LYPFILRRTKEQVAKDLPEKIETVLFCEMEDEQRKIYDAYRNDFRDQILGIWQTRRFERRTIADKAVTAARLAQDTRDMTDPSMAMCDQVICERRRAAHIVHEHSIDHRSAEPIVDGHKGHRLARHDLLDIGKAVADGSKDARLITKIEQSIVKGIIQRALTEIQRAWKTIADLTFKLEGDFYGAATGAFTVTDAYAAYRINEHLLIPSGRRRSRVSAFADGSRGSCSMR